MCLAVVSDDASHRLSSRVASSVFQEVMYSTVMIEATTSKEAIKSTKRMYCTSAHHPHPSDYFHSLSMA